LGSACFTVGGSDTRGGSWRSCEVYSDPVMQNISSSFSLVCQIFGLVHRMKLKIYIKPKILMVIMAFHPNHIYVTCYVFRFSPKVCRTSGNCNRIVTIIFFVMLLVGPLSPRHGASSGCGWRRLPPVLEGSCEYVE
jgi:hypothetical protein